MPVSQQQSTALRIVLAAEVLSVAMLWRYFWQYEGSGLGDHEETWLEGQHHSSYSESRHNNKDGASKV